MVARGLSFQTRRYVCFAYSTSRIFVASSPALFTLLSRSFWRTFVQRRETRRSRPPNAFIILPSVTITRCRFDGHFVLERFTVVLNELGNDTLPYYTAIFVDRNDRRRPSNSTRCRYPRNTLVQIYAEEKRTIRRRPHVNRMKYGRLFRFRLDPLFGYSGTLLLKYEKYAYFRVGFIGYRYCAYLLPATAAIMGGRKKTSNSLRLLLLLTDVVQEFSIIRLRNISKIRARPSYFEVLDGREKQPGFKPNVPRSVSPPQRVFTVQKTRYAEFVTRVRTFRQILNDRP